MTVQHLLGISSLSKKAFYGFLHDGMNFVEVSERTIKKVPTLRGKTIINFFAEASTRTRASFEIAGKRLSADTINLGGGGSSLSKGESLLDTLETLQAMHPDVVVIRHKESGSPHFLARQLRGTSIVNAGDGMNEHPTQALLDCLSLLQHFKDRPDGIENLTVAIVGDVRHSRVARSAIWAHKLLGNRVRLVGPPTLVPKEFEAPECFGSHVSTHYNLREGVEGADVVMCLRMQLERQEAAFVPSLQEYTNEYFVTEALLKAVAPEAVVLHPGPINRGVEVESALANGPRSLVTRQVTNGVAIRMAVLFALCHGMGDKSVEQGSSSVGEGQ